MSRKQLKIFLAGFSFFGNKETGHQPSQPTSNAFGASQDLLNTAPHFLTEVWGFLCFNAQCGYEVQGESPMLTQPIRREDTRGLVMYQPRTLPDRAKLDTGDKPWLSMPSQDKVKTAIGELSLHSRLVQTMVLAQSL